MTQSDLIHSRPGTARTGLAGSPARLQSCLTALLATTVLSAGGCSAFEETTSWEERVAIAGGSTLQVSRSVTTGPDEWFRPGRGATLQSTPAATIPGIGAVEFKWIGYEMPVTFDIVNGVPWVVLPIAGLDSCQKYGNPAESVAAFSWKNGRWDWQPFEEAPRELAQNLSRSPPYDEYSRAQRKLTLDRPFDPHFGVLLTKGVIAEHVKWTHACHRINPPPDPQFQRSLAEYAEKPRVELTAIVVETRDDVLSLTREENISMMGPLLPEGKRRIIGCQGKVDRQESIFSTRRTNGGTRGSLTANRIALAADDGNPRSIYLPVSPVLRTHIARITCSGSLIYVVVREKRDEVTVVPYDLDGNWNNAWRIRIAGFEVPENQWGTIFAFDDQGDRFTLSIGEYQYNNGQAGLPAATIGRRFRIEAMKS